MTSKQNPDGTPDSPKRRRRVGDLPALSPARLCPDDAGSVSNRHAAESPHTAAMEEAPDLASGAQPGAGPADGDRSPVTAAMSAEDCPPFVTPSPEALAGPGQAVKIEGGTSSLDVASAAAAFIRKYDTSFDSLDPADLLPPEVPGSIDDINDVLPKSTPSPDAAIGAGMPNAVSPPPPAVPIPAANQDAVILPLVDMASSLHLTKYQDRVDPLGVLGDAGSGESGTIDVLSDDRSPADLPPDFVVGIDLGTSDKTVITVRDMDGLLHSFDLDECDACPVCQTNLKARRKRARYMKGYMADRRAAKREKNDE